MRSLADNGAEIAFPQELLSKERTTKRIILYNELLALEGSRSDNSSKERRHRHQHRKKLRALTDGGRHQFLLSFWKLNSRMSFQANLVSVRIKVVSQWVLAGTNRAYAKRNWSGLLGVNTPKGPSYG